MIQLKEYEQLIHIKADKELTQDQVKHTLLQAQLKRRYAKFYTNKFYIMVNFNIDGTVHISSNYYTNHLFRKELDSLENKKMMLFSMSEFIYRWMNRLRKM